MTKTFLIQLSGLVQGVGFRPLVYQIAREKQLRGTVSNGSEGVRLTLLLKDEQAAQQVVDEIVLRAPALAQITEVTVKEINNQFFENFAIVQSHETAQVTLLLTPDFALCPACQHELTDPTDRRFRYPFISCTQCGPRFSSITQLPYDRPQTTMAEFPLCAACQAEYDAPTERRFYAQTTACPACGPQLAWYEVQNGEAVLSIGQDSNMILKQVTQVLNQGKLVAVKGIGGYLLLGDATNAETVQQLRSRKHRPTKPFALLYPNLEAAQREVLVREQEAEALLSSAAPIVLLRRLSGATVVEDVAPGLQQLGVMLPYAPLLALISADFGKPLVATSGNLSGNPIVFEDEKALAQLPQVADFILTHNRRIVVPQDDSVVRFTEGSGQKIVVRRSRGAALVLNLAGVPDHSGCFLSMGASMKGTFALYTLKQLYVSQYMGDLESYETQQSFRQSLAHLLHILAVSPEQQVKGIFADAHEGYFSTQLALELGKKWSVPVHKVPHHAAHFCAVLAENNLLNISESVAGIVWDGAGFGPDDGQIWGGEFFIYSNKKIERVAHFDYFESMLGDKMAREPRISALCLCKNIPQATELLKPKFSEKERQIYQKMLAQNTLKTSSAGRLFDGVASLLGLGDRQSYEGQAALRLEQLAAGYFRTHGLSSLDSYLPDFTATGLLSTQQMIRGVVQDLADEKPKDWIAAKFHLSLVGCIAAFARQQAVTKIACSGGVFQNAVLVDLLLATLGKEFELYFHKELSPNDESVSYGQMAYGLLTYF
ncbi:carbamoyltransferase HypF [Arundinibacter roseus]|uniref:Carbamoyltransferase n=1 Tax=Arundinibacter roseus TaxID=2070510 RepID=A0A4V2X8N7_9BACT|nr:carbamoyltransferase HypF [Arundinibacter roseus]TDB60395.1 carbamoyltransferase HypF [Arundinibacter roseus]